MLIIKNLASYFIKLSKIIIKSLSEIVDPK
jgi:hypothetical protein